MIRADIHKSFSELIDSIFLPKPKLKKLQAKLLATFNSKHYEAKSEIARLEIINAVIQQNIVNKVETATDPKNMSIR